MVPVTAFVNIQIFGWWPVFTKHAFLLCTPLSPCLLIFTKPLQLLFINIKKVPSPQSTKCPHHKKPIILISFPEKNPPPFTDPAPCLHHILTALHWYPPVGHDRDPLVPLFRRKRFTDGIGDSHGSCWWVMSAPWEGTSWAVRGKPARRTLILR